MYGLPILQEVRDYIRDKVRPRIDRNVVFCNEALGCLTTLPFGRVSLSKATFRNQIFCQFFGLFVVALILVFGLFVAISQINFIRLSEERESYHPRFAIWDIFAWRSDKALKPENFLTSVEDAANPVHQTKLYR